MEIQHELIELTRGLLPFPSLNDRSRSRVLAEVYSSLPEIFELNGHHARTEVMDDVLEEVCAFLQNLLDRLGGASQDNYVEMFPWTRMCEYVYFAFV